MNLSRSTESLLYDLVVIGGGINGAAIARDAALRGLSVCLLEKGDFGSGASSKTSKLAHGGLRYLEQYRFSLVRESLRERDLLFKNAPHLVRPLPFLVPVYKGGTHYLSTIRLGLKIYDFFGGAAGMPKHVKVNPEGVIKAFPLIKSEGLLGGCLYYDGQMDDARLVLENIISAEQAGSDVYNYTSVDSLIKEKGMVAGVTATDLITGNTFKISGRVIARAAGAWTGKMEGASAEEKGVSAAPTKGVHLVIEGQFNGPALLLNAPCDGRVFFIMPWEGRTLIGTTDTFYDGNPDDVKVTDEDVNYLLDAYNAYFPDAKLSSESVAASFAGLRPLVAQGVGLEPSEVGREHVIERRSDGLITILGGKYTTYRAVAEEAVDKVVAALPAGSRIGPCVTAKSPLPGAAGPYTLKQVREKLTDRGFCNEIAERLTATYGARSILVADYLFSDPSFCKPISPSHPYLWGEVDFAIREEHARHPDDWLYRRSKMGYGPFIGTKCMEEIAAKFIA